MLNAHSCRSVKLDSSLQKDIGWRPEAKRLLLVMTDQPSHLALDSKLSGIVVPHDGRCHLEDNIYSKTTTMVRLTKPEHQTWRCAVVQFSPRCVPNQFISLFLTLPFYVHKRGKCCIKHMLGLENYFFHTKKGNVTLEHESSHTQHRYL